MSKSKIEWTDETWNPVTGCTKVSPGCKHCYAERLWPRLAGNPKHVAFGREFTDVQCHPERLEQPLRWKRPRMVFVNSMSDLFHEDVPFGFIDAVFCIMAFAKDHTFQVLTKRPDRMLEYFNSKDDAFPEYPVKDKWATPLMKKISSARGLDVDPIHNVWLGVSVEDQATADERIPLLLQTPAAVRWISAEPLIGPVDATPYLSTCRSGRDGDCIWPGCPQIRDAEPETSGRHCPCDTDDRDGWVEPALLDWVVVGGESGPKARPMHPEWARTLRDQCEAAGVPFFFKQWGEWGVSEDVEKHGIAHNGWWEDCREDGGVQQHDWKDGDFPCACTVSYRVGKKAAGCLLDGVEHKEWPKHA